VTVLKNAIQGEHKGKAKSLLEGFDQAAERTGLPPGIAADLKKKFENEADGL